MALHQNIRILYILLLAELTLSSSSSFAAAPSPSVYEILPQFGLPRGLLPDQVKSYTLSKNGEFEVNLDKPCYVQFDCVVYYEEKITGKLNLGSITNLKGIQVQRFYLWFDVDEIRVDLPPSDSIYFTFGFINKQLDVGQFQIVHSCFDKKKKVSALYAEETFKNFLQVAFYDTVITGKLSYGKVSQVSGIQAKKVFIWVSVDGMEVDEKSNMIEFHAGFFTQGMPAEAFQTIPVCHEKGFQEYGFDSI